MAERKGATIWVPTRKDRDAINKKCKPGETVAEMLKRKRII